MFPDFLCHLVFLSGKGEKQRIHRNRLLCLGVG